MPGSPHRRSPPSASSSPAAEAAVAAAAASAAAAMRASDAAEDAMQQLPPPASSSLSASSTSLSLSNRRRNGGHGQGNGGNESNGRRSDGATTLGAAALSLLKKHKADWLTLVGLAVVVIGLQFVYPAVRYVDAETLKINDYPLYPNTVPSFAVPLISVVFPILLFSFFFVLKWDMCDYHQCILGLLYSVALTALVTDTLKLSVGRPRPDFLWRCFVDGNPVFGVDGNVVCNGSASEVEEGRKSFPSGHSSWSFAGLGYLALYLAGKLKAFNGSGRIHVVVVSLLPLAGAAGVAMSRVQDYWHWPTDVMTGGIIGLMFSSICYLMHYPLLSNDTCDTPFVELSPPWEATTASGSNLPSRQQPPRDNEV